MKVLVTGVKGQLGYDVMNELAKRGYEGVGVDVDEMDITDRAAVERVIGEVHPDKVVHCAAWTAVDAAEDNQEVCHKVNEEGTENIARICGKLDIPMVYISTDYVFDGQGTRPWEPDDPVVKPCSSSFFFSRRLFVGRFAFAGYSAELTGSTFTSIPA